MRRWREYAEKIAKAVEDLVPEAEVYVSGVAEDRTTIYNNIDVLIAIPARVLDDKRKRISQ